MLNRHMRPSTLLSLALLYALEAVAIEIPVGPPVLGEANGIQREARIASDGENFLAVWRDQRRDTSESLVATRLSGSGEVLDPTGITLVPRLSSNVPPCLVWSGTSYQLFWSSDSLTEPSRVFVLRVDRDGRVLGSPRVVATSARLSDGARCAASDGSRVVVVYHHDVPGGAYPEVRAAILNTDADVLSDLRLAATAVPRIGMSIAVNFTDFVIVWQRSTQNQLLIDATRINAAGDIQPPVQIAEGATPLIAGDGRDFVVLSEIAGRWFSRRISRSLTVLTVDFDVPEDAPMDLATPVWTGDRYIVYGARLRSGSEVVRISIDAEGRPSAPVREERIDSSFPGSQPQLDAASNGSAIVRTWSESEQNEFRVMGRAVPHASIESISGEPRVLTVSANAQRAVSVAHGLGIDLVAWREDAGVFVTRIDALGRSLDGRGVQLGTQRGTVAPSVAFDGTQFLVAWTELAENGAAVVRFVSPGTGVLPDVLHVEDAGFGLSLAPGSDGTLVTWASGREPRAIFAGLIPRGGLAFRGTPVAVWSDTAEHSIPVAAWNGSSFLIAWSDVLRIVGVRVSTNLTRLDAQPLLLGDAPDGDDRDPALASDGHGWLLLWNDLESVRARRVAGNGTPEGASSGVVIARGILPRVVFSGTRYVAAWKVPPEDVSVDPPFEVRYGFIDAGGTLAPIDSVPLASTFNLDVLSLASQYTGRFTLAYTRLATEPLYGGVARAFIQRLGPVKRRAVR